MKTIKLFLSLLSLSLISHAQSLDESLRVYWPKDIQWKRIKLKHDSTQLVTVVVPFAENARKWTIAGYSFTTYHKGIDIDAAIKYYTNAALKASSKSVVTVIERNDKENWFLLKTETSDFPNDSIPESNLWYVRTGKMNHFAVYVALKEKEFSKKFIEKWVTIFKTSELVYTKSF